MRLVTSLLASLLFLTTSGGQMLGQAVNGEKFQCTDGYKWRRYHVQKERKVDLLADIFPAEKTFRVRLETGWADRTYAVFQLVAHDKNNQEVYRKNFTRDGDEHTVHASRVFVDHAISAEAGPSSYAEICFHFYP
jgi:alpha-amylase/alpha-mannosidase (GH57 family)